MSYLPPQTREALRTETIRLVGICFAGIVLLAAAVFCLTV